MRLPHREGVDEQTLWSGCLSRDGTGQVLPSLQDRPHTGFLPHLGDPGRLHRRHPWALQARPPHHSLRAGSQGHLGLRQVRPRLPSSALPLLPPSTHVVVGVASGACMEVCVCVWCADVHLLTFRRNVTCVSCVCFVSVHVCTRCIWLCSESRMLLLMGCVMRGLSRNVRLAWDV